MHCCLEIVGKVNKWKDHRERCFQAYSHLHFSLLIASAGMHVLKSFIVSVTLLGGGGVRLKPIALDRQSRCDQDRSSTNCCISSHII